jgi:hypothetical protein
VHPDAPGKIVLQHDAAASLDQRPAALGPVVVEIPLVAHVLLDERRALGRHRRLLQRTTGIERFCGAFIGIGRIEDHRRGIERAGQRVQRPWPGLRCEDGVVTGVERPLDLQFHNRPSLPRQPPHLRGLPSG